MSNRRARHAVRIALTIILASFSAVAVQAAGDPLEVELPTIELMDRMHAKWAARQMTYNGVPMTIRTFESSDSTEDILRHYERIWTARNVGETVRTVNDEFQTLGFRDGDVYYTIQARSRGEGATGALVVTGALEDFAHTRETEFPLPSNTTVVTRIEALDLERRSETLAISSDRDAASLAVDLRQSLAAQGWREQSASESPDGAARVLSLQRDRELCQVTFLDQGFEKETTVLVHWVKR